MTAPASTPQFTASGKTAIVTGAGSGINFEFAKLLLDRQCNVIIADLALRPEAQQLVETYQKSPRAVFQKTDVTDWGQLSRLFKVANTEFGGVDLVCPGAGVFEPHWTNFWYPPGMQDSPSRDPVEGFGHYALLDINVTHVIRLTQLAISAFLNPQDGDKASPANPKRIVNIASIAGGAAVPSAPMYAASKWAVIGFTRSLEQLEPNLGIRVNACAPGMVQTPLWTEHPEKLQWFNEEQDKWATPQEVAHAMLRLAEDPELLGGTILEVGSGSTRIVPLFNNPGPSGDGLSASNIGLGRQEALQQLNVPGWGVHS